MATTAEQVTYETGTNAELREKIRRWEERSALLERLLMEANEREHRHLETIVKLAAKLAGIRDDDRPSTTFKRVGDDVAML